MDRFRQSPSDLEEKFRREFREIDFPLFVSSIQIQIEERYRRRRGEIEERGGEGYIRFRAIPISRFLGEKSPRGATRARINEASA